MNTTDLVANRAVQRSRISPPSHQRVGGVGGERPGLIEPLRPLHHESYHGDGAASFRAGIAHTAWQQEQARELVRRRYRQVGYRVPGHSEHGSQNTLITLAVRGLTPIGTLCLWRDTPHGLQADKLFNTALNELRASGARIAEFGRLAFEAPTPFARLLSPLVHTASLLGLKEWGMTDIVVECHPRHAEFYCNALSFSQLSEAVHCPSVGAPAVLLHLSAQHALNIFARPVGRQRVEALRSGIVPKNLPSLLV